MTARKVGEAVISDAAVAKATGKPWADWFRLLDRWGAASRSHRDIAAHLKDEVGLPAWWSQTVAVRYERERGLRKPGQRSGGRYEVTAQRTIAAGMDDAWMALTDARVMGRWLGAGARSSARVGGSFSTAGGARGRYMLLERPRRIRFTWEHETLAPETRVDVELSRRSATRAVVRLTHSGIATVRDRAAVKRFWAGAMDAFQALFAPQPAKPAPSRSAASKPVTPKRKESAMKLKAGDPAPAFTLPDQNGDEHALADYAGKWVLLYFYPKDDTPGCTTEACGLRDNYAAYKRQKVAVLGVSPDSVKSHGKFAAKFELPFTLLADVDKEVVEAYGVWGKKKFMGREYMGVNRVSFLIDPKGKIAKVYEKVKPAEHAEEVLADRKALAKA